MLSNKINAEKSLNKKRMVFWVSGALAFGSVVGSYFVPPLVEITTLSLVIMVAAYKSIDSQMSDIISRMKPYISLEELIQDGFPLENEPDRVRLIEQHRAPNDNNKKEKISKVGAEVFAQSVLFSDASRTSALAPAVNAKQDSSPVEVRIVSPSN